MGLLSSLADRALNRTAAGGALPASPAALDLHRSQPIVDLVVGTALFRRDLLRPARRGHVDLPRARAAGVNVLGLTVATRFPDLDGRLSALHFGSLGLRRPHSRSDIEIATWLIDRIHGWVERSGGALRLLQSPVDLDAALAPDGPLGVFIGVQGGHALSGDPANVALLRRRGVLMLAPAHVMDNALVGSSTGRQAGGLTAHGREVIAAAQQAGMAVDLAHMSLSGIEQAMPLMREPFTLSHTGIIELSGRSSRWRRYSAATRNVPASVVAEVGRAGGIVGTILATDLLGGSRLSDAAFAVRRMAQLAGPDQAALGSDMDGALRMVIDVAGLPALSDELLRAGTDRSVVERVMGGNAARLLRGVIG
ncbi:MAG TPA: membrane dipeptidase [Candidatus Limnocylindrales bacterium]|nr:membrane dipeptidase [Candidatus Limnocylindrales bacterium]